MNEVLLDQVETLQSKLTQAEESGKRGVEGDVPASGDRSTERRGSRGFPSAVSASLQSVLEDDIRALKQSNGALLAELASVREAHRTELSRLRAERDEAQCRGDEAVSGRQRAEDKLAVQTEEYRRCLKRCTRVEAKAKEAASALEAANADRASLSERLDALREQNTGLTKQQQKLERKCGEQAA